MKKGRLRIRQNQTDCVFLHPEGVVVFEVKRWLSHILVDAMRDEIAVTKKDGITKYGSGKGPSAQVIAARKALFSEVAGLDGRRVCSMVVFVDPLSMSGDPGEPTSRKHVYFGQLHKGGTGTVRKAVEQCISIWRKRDDGAKKIDVVSIAEKLLDECSCHTLPLNPKRRMGG